MHLIISRLISVTAPIRAILVAAPLPLSVSGATAAGACSLDSFQRVPLAFGVDTLAVCTVALTAVQVCVFVLLGVKMQRGNHGPPRINQSVSHVNPKKKVLDVWFDCQ